MPLTMEEGHKKYLGCYMGFIFFLICAHCRLSARANDIILTAYHVAVGIPQAMVSAQKSYYGRYMGLSFLRLNTLFPVRVRG